MSREILTFDLPEGHMVGTAHLPDGRTPQPPTRRIGALLLNPGAAPRAGNSDLSIYICEALANEGFPAFRFDMPGLGDSPGDVPDEVDDYWQQVFLGRNDQAALAVLRELKKRYDLDSLLIGGLCAGAVTAVRVTDIDDSNVAGLLLLEPNFRLAGDLSTREEAMAMSESKDQAQAPKSRLRKGLSPRAWLHLLTGDNALARLVSPLRPMLINTLTSYVGHSLPTDTNVPMVLAWYRVMRQCVPTLVVTATGKIEDVYCWRILNDLPLHYAQDISVEGIPFTNHIFTAGTARDQATRIVSAWVKRQFPATANRSAMRDAVQEQRPEAALRHSNGVASSSHTAELSAARR